jgi:hypothetical protein
MLPSVVPTLESCSSTRLSWSASSSAAESWDFSGDVSVSAWFNWSWRLNSEANRPPSWGPRKAWLIWRRWSPPSPWALRTAWMIESVKPLLVSMPKPLRIAWLSGRGKNVEAPRYRAVPTEEPVWPVATCVVAEIARSWLRTSFLLVEPAAFCTAASERAIAGSVSEARAPRRRCAAEI